MRRVASGGFILASLVLGCGGRTHSGATESEAVLGGAGASTSDAMANGDVDSGCGASATGCGSKGDTELGECQLGFPASGTNKPCAWIADNRCYESRQMACNCACPRDHDSVCTSGFGAGTDGRVPVDCF